MEEALKKKFADSIAPGQTNEFLAILNDETIETAEELKIPDEIAKLIEMYKNSDASCLPISRPY